MSKPWVRSTSREQDDRLLLWLYWYDRGFTFAEIGRHAGVSYQTVQRAIKDVLNEIKKEKTVDA